MITSEGSLSVIPSSRSTACVKSKKRKEKGRNAAYIHQAVKVYDIYMGRAFARGPHITWIEMKESMYDM